MMYGIQGWRRVELNGDFMNVFTDTGEYVLHRHGGVPGNLLGANVYPAINLWHLQMFLFILVYVIY